MERELNDTFVIEKEYLEDISSDYHVEDIAYQIQKKMEKKGYTKEQIKITFSFKTNDIYLNLLYFFDNKWIQIGHVSIHTHLNRGYIDSTSGAFHIKNNVHENTFRIKPMLKETTSPKNGEPVQIVGYLKFKAGDKALEKSPDFTIPSTTKKISPITPSSTPQIPLKTNKATLEKQMRTFKLSLSQRIKDAEKEQKKKEKEDLKETLSNLIKEPFKIFKESVIEVLNNFLKYHSQIVTTNTELNEAKEIRKKLIENAARYIKNKSELSLLKNNLSNNLTRQRSRTIKQKLSSTSPNMKKRIEENKKKTEENISNKMNELKNKIDDMIKILEDEKQKYESKIVELKQQNKSAYKQKISIKEILDQMKSIYLSSKIDEKMINDEKKEEAMYKDYMDTIEKKIKEIDTEYEKYKLELEKNRLNYQLVGKKNKTHKKIKKD